MKLVELASVQAVMLAMEISSSGFGTGRMKLGDSFGVLC